MFYASDGYGLGHVNICLAIMQAVARRQPEALLLLVSGTPHAHTFVLPSNADFLKLPAVAHAAQYAALPAAPDPETPLRGLWYLREALLLQAALTFRPDVLHVDWWPAGQAGELRRVIPALRAAKPDVLLVAGLPDMTDPGELRSEWHTHDARRLLDNLYDRVVIYGDATLYDPADDYALSAATRAKTSFSGYLRRSVELAQPSAVRARLGLGDEPFIVATVGGGEDGARLLETWLAALHEPPLAGVASRIISGPLLDRADQDRLAALAVGLPHETVTPFMPDLSELLNAADAVVAMGGYNTAVELVALRQRAVLVPRVGQGDEQLLRAQRFASRGLVRMLHPDDLSPARLAAEARAALDAPRPTASLDLSGADRLGELLADGLR